MSETAQDAPLAFTEAAARKVRRLLDEEQNDNLKLRVYITGGGVPVFPMDSPSMKIRLMMIQSWSVMVCCWSLIR